jgi:5-methyltetrahydrofolate--homocysteine methyltransferase
MDGISALVSSALSEGLTPEAILSESLTTAMAIVGDEYEQGERFVPEMLVSAETMKIALSILQPLLKEDDVPPAGVVVIGTVEGDLHDIGKDLVAMMLEGAGFQVVNLGVDVSADAFVRAAQENQADIVAMSALLTTTMVNMRGVVEALQAVGARDSVRVMVGGAPLSSEFAASIGADGYAPDAASAVRLAKRLLDS